MTVECKTVTVRRPAKIEATNMNVTPLECDISCTFTLSITWTNTGGRSGSFEPAIKIDNVRISIGALTPLDTGQGITITYEISDLSEGTHEICPDPN